MKQEPLPPPNPTEWMTLAAVADLLGVHKNTVTRMIRDGKLIPYRPFGAHRERCPTMLWRPEVNEVFSARLRLAAKEPAAATGATQ